MVMQAATCAVALVLLGCFPGQDGMIASVCFAASAIARLARQATTDQLKPQQSKVARRWEVSTHATFISTSTGIVYHTGLSAPHAAFLWMASGWCSSVAIVRFCILWGCLRAAERASEPAGINTTKTWCRRCTCAHTGHGRAHAHAHTPLLPLTTLPRLSGHATAAANSCLLTRITLLCAGCSTADARPRTLRCQVLWKFLR